MINLKLKEYIEAKGISMYYIQKKTGIRYATILNIVNRNTTALNLKHLQKIMEAINVSDMNVILEVDRKQFNKRK